MRNSMDLVWQWRKTAQRSIALFLLGLFLGAGETAMGGIGGDSKGAGADRLRIGSLLPSTGDLSFVGQPMVATVPLAIKTINACGGVNGKPVELVSEDDQTDPTAGYAAMEKLALAKVVGVVGSFAGGVSQAAVESAKRNKVMLVSPGTTSSVFTGRAQKGDFKNGEFSYWSRTAPPDTYQAQALAKLAQQKGLKRVSTVVMNNDYGRGFEKEFVEAFKKLGGTVTNEKNPTRYDPKVASLDSTARAAFGGKPEGVAAAMYAETESLLLKSAYQQGLTQGVQILLTDGVKFDEFARQVGKTKEGKLIIEGAIGTVLGADGKGLAALSKLWEAEKKTPLPPYVPQTWDAAALLMLAAQSAKANTGEAIASKIREVANGPGEEVTDVCKGLELLKAGKRLTTRERAATWILMLLEML
jgi:neutral amino acid transport system substrate-binding protein